MNWRDTHYCILVTDFLGREEYSFAVYKDEVEFLEELGFEKVYYNAYESEIPFSEIRYLTPPKRVLREVFRLIESGDLKKVGQNASGTLYDGGMMNRFIKKKRQGVKGRLNNLKHQRDLATLKKMERMIEAKELRESGHVPVEIASIMGVAVSSVYIYLR